jgi:hypothetical protein
VRDVDVLPNCQRVPIDEPVGPRRDDIAGRLKEGVEVRSSIRHRPGQAQLCPPAGLPQWVRPVEHQPCVVRLVSLLEEMRDRRAGIEAGVVRKVIPVARGLLLETNRERRRGFWSGDGGLNEEPDREQQQRAGSYRTVPGTIWMIVL